MSQMLLSLFEADQHLQIYDCFMVYTMSVINFIVVCEENTAPIKRIMFFLTLLMMNIYARTIVQIQEPVFVFFSFATVTVLYLLLFTLVFNVSLKIFKNN